MSLIILAAGIGRRLPEPLRRVPKCLIKIKNKSLLEHNLDFYNLYKNRYIVTGYKSHKLNKFIKKNKFKEYKNKEYKTTNMVCSLFKLINFKGNFLTICYGDIIFDYKIYYNLIKKKNNVIILKRDWLKLWRLRMTKKKILSDAENVIVKNNRLIAIGEPINKSLPKYQYMGILKIIKKDFFKLKYFYNKIQNKKIDFTNFINLAIKKKIIKFKVTTTSKFWYEIDNFKDVQILANKKKW